MSVHYFLFWEKYPYKHPKYQKHHFHRRDYGKWFHGKMLAWECFCVISTVWEITVWKNEKFSLTKEIFRQINSLVKPLLSRNFCQKCVREIFCNFHTVEIYPTWKNFREINLQYNSLIEKLLWRNFCKKDCGEKLFKFPHCVIVNYPN